MDPFNVFFGVCFGLVFLILCFVLGMLAFFLPIRWWLVFLNLAVAGVVTWFLMKYAGQWFDGLFQKRITQFRKRGLHVTSFREIPQGGYFYLLDFSGRRRVQELQVKLTESTYQYWRKNPHFPVFRVMMEGIPVESLTTEETDHFLRLL